MTSNRVNFVRHIEMLLYCTFVNVFPSQMLISAWSPVLIVDIIRIFIFIHILLKSCQCFFFNSQTFSYICSSSNTGSTMSFNYSPCKSYIILFKIFIFASLSFTSILKLDKVGGDVPIISVHCNIRF